MLRVFSLAKTTMAGCCCNRRAAEREDSSPSANGLKVLAAQTLKIASMNGIGDTDKLETELEDEIRWEESRAQPREILGRVMVRCEEIVHSKQVLLFVVILNVIDCLLVMGELTLDFHHVSYLFIAYKEHDVEFSRKMKDIYPHALQNLTASPITDLYNEILLAFVYWNTSQTYLENFALDCKEATSLALTQSFPGSYILDPDYKVTLNRTSDSESIMYHLSGRDDNASWSRSSNFPMTKVEEENLIVIKVAHGLHFASISILCVLVAETLLKIFCTGRRFFKKKMEVYDAVIILISFALDIIFVEGLTNLAIESFVVILSFMLPWRILRVLNSLVVAVMDQQRFHMKLLYKQKRKIAKNLSDANEKVKSLEKQIETLKNMCLSKGVHEWEMKAVLEQTAPNGTSGLNALSKLACQAANAFTSMPSPRKSRSSPTVKDESLRDFSLHRTSPPEDVPNGAIHGPWSKSLAQSFTTFFLDDECNKMDTMSTVINEDDFVSRL